MPISIGQQTAPEPWEDPYSEEGLDYEVAGAIDPNWQAGPGMPGAGAIWPAAPIPQPEQTWRMMAGRTTGTGPMTGYGDVYTAAGIMLGMSAQHVRMVLDRGNLLQAPPQEQLSFLHTYAGKRAGTGSPMAPQWGGPAASVAMASAVAEHQILAQGRHIGRSTEARPGEYVTGPRAAPGSVLQAIPGVIPEVTPEGTFLHTGAWTPGKLAKELHLGTQQNQIWFPGLGAPQFANIKAFGTDIPERVQSATTFLSFSRTTPEGQSLFDPSLGAPYQQRVKNVVIPEGVSPQLSIGQTFGRGESPVVYPGHEGIDLGPHYRQATVTHLGMGQRGEQNVMNVGLTAEMDISQLSALKAYDIKGGLSVSPGLEQRWGAQVFAGDIRGYMQLGAGVASVAPPELRRKIWGDEPFTRYGLEQAEAWRQYLIQNVGEHWSATPALYRDLDPDVQAKLAPGVEMLRPLGPQDPYEVTKYADRPAPEGTSWYLEKAIGLRVPMAIQATIAYAWRRQSEGIEATEMIGRFHPELVSAYREMDLQSGGMEGARGIGRAYFANLGIKRFPRVDVGALGMPEQAQVQERASAILARRGVEQGTQIYNQMFPQAFMTALGSLYRGNLLQFQVQGGEPFVGPEPIAAMRFTGSARPGSQLRGLARNEYRLIQSLWETRENIYRTIAMREEGDESLADKTPEEMRDIVLAEQRELAQTVRVGRPAEGGQAGEPGVEMIAGGGTWRRAGLGLRTSGGRWGGQFSPVQSLPFNRWTGGEDVLQTLVMTQGVGRGARQQLIQDIMEGQVEGPNMLGIRNPFLTEEQAQLILGYMPRSEWVEKGYGSAEEYSTRFRSSVGVGTVVGPHGGGDWDVDPYEGLATTMYRRRGRRGPIERRSLIRAPVATEQQILQWAMAHPAQEVQASAGKIEAMTSREQAVKFLERQDAESGLPVSHQRLTEQETLDLVLSRESTKERTGPIFNIYKRGMRERITGRSEAAIRARGELAGLALTAIDVKAVPDEFNELTQLPMSLNLATGGYVSSEGGPAWIGGRGLKDIVGGIVSRVQNLPIASEVEGGLPISSSTRAAMIYNPGADPETFAAVQEAIEQGTSVWGPLSERQRTGGRRGGRMSDEELLGEMPFIGHTIGQAALRGARRANVIEPSGRGWRSWLLEATDRGIRLATRGEADRRLKEAMAGGGVIPAEQALVSFLESGSPELVRSAKHLMWQMGIRKRDLKRAQSARASVLEQARIEELKTVATEQARTTPAVVPPAPAEETREMPPSVEDMTAEEVQATWGQPTAPAPAPAVPAAQQPAAPQTRRQHLIDWLDSGDPQKAANARAWMAQRGISEEQLRTRTVTPEEGRAALAAASAGIQVDPNLSAEDAIRIGQGPTSQAEEPPGQSKWIDIGGAPRGPVQPPGGAPPKPPTTGVVGIAGGGKDDDDGDGDGDGWKKFSMMFSRILRGVAGGEDISAGIRGGRAYLSVGHPQYEESMGKEAQLLIGQAMDIAKLLDMPLRQGRPFSKAELALVAEGKRITSRLKAIERAEPRGEGLLAAAEETDTAIKRFFTTQQSTDLLDAPVLAQSQKTVATIEGAAPTQLTPAGEAWLGQTSPETLMRGGVGPLQALRLTRQGVAGLSQESLREVVPGINAAGEAWSKGTPGQLRRANELLDKFSEGLQDATKTVEEHSKTVQANTQLSRKQLQAAAQARGTATGVLSAIRQIEQATGEDTTDPRLIGLREQAQEVLHQQALTALDMPEQQGEWRGLRGIGQRLMTGWGLMQLSRMWRLTGGATMQAIPTAAGAEQAAAMAAQAGLPLGEYQPSEMGLGLMSLQAQRGNFQIAMGQGAYDAWGGILRAGGRDLGTALGVAGVPAGAGLISGLLTSWAAPGMGLAGPVGLTVAGLGLAIGAAGWTQAQREDPNALAISLATPEEGLTIPDRIRRWIAGRAVGGEWPLPGQGRPEAPSRAELQELGPRLLSGDLRGLTQSQRMAAIRSAAQAATGEGGLFPFFTETQAMEYAGQWMQYMPGGEDVNIREDVFEDPTIAQAAFAGQAPSQWTGLAQRWSLGSQGPAQIQRAMMGMSGVQGQMFEDVSRYTAPLARFGVTMQDTRDIVMAGGLGPGDRRFLQRLGGGDRMAWTQVGMDQGVDWMQTVNPYTGMQIGSNWGGSILARAIQRPPGDFQTFTLGGREIANIGPQMGLNIGAVANRIQFTPGGQVMVGDRAVDFNAQSLAEESLRTQREYAEAQYGRQMAGLGAQWTYQHQMWDIQQDQIDLSQAYQMQQFGFQEASIGMGLSQTMERLGRQEARLGTTSRWGMENLEIGIQRQRVQFGWQEQDLAFRGAQNQLQFGWQMEDFEEAERFATGRQRRQIRRQRERATISFGMGMGQLAEQGDRLEQRRGWAEEDFDRERDRHGQRLEWAREDIGMSRRHASERAGLATQRLEATRDYYQQNQQLQEDQRKLSRQYWKDQHARQKESIIHAKDYRVEMLVIQDLQNAVALATQGHLGWFASEFEDGGRLHTATKDFIADLISDLEEAGQVLESWVTPGKKTSVGTGTTGDKP